MGLKGKLVHNFIPITGRENSDQLHALGLRNIQLEVSCRSCRAQELQRNIGERREPEHTDSSDIVHEEHQCWWVHDSCPPTGFGPKERGEAEETLTFGTCLFGPERVWIKQDSVLWLQIARNTRPEMGSSDPL